MPAGFFVVLIPNKKMVEKGRPEDIANYERFMIEAARRLTGRGIDVLFLNHEGAPDQRLAEEFNAAAGGAGRVVSDVSGGACKWIIGHAGLVISSRFHGLMSALSEGVPVLCTSWSHKYRELAEDLGVPDSCLDLSDVEKALQTVDAALGDPGRYTASAERLSAMRGSVLRMWDEIFGRCPRNQDVEPAKDRPFFWIPPTRPLPRR